MINLIIENEAQKIADYINANFEGRARDITINDFTFDDSRSWSFYIAGALLGLSCNKFGAYRNYLGGGVRGEMQHNGRDQDSTTGLGNMFAAALRAIEAAYNGDSDELEPWELASGVLL